jgi:acid phosphatase family membrane protein YuiD
MKTPKLLTIAALTLMAIPGLAQMPEDHDHAAMQEETSMEMSCAGMMKMHEGMKQKMEAADARLATLVEQMNATKGTAKTDRMAAVINELVDQRRAMHEGMMTMQPMMMRHMMGHMQSGMMKGMKKGMSSCPMMDKSKSDEATNHEKHH